MTITATEWRNRGGKLMRHDADSGKWLCMVTRVVENGEYAEGWTWAVSWPGHRSLKSRQSGRAPTVATAAASADAFARSVGIELTGELPKPLAEDLVARCVPTETID